MVLSNVRVCFIGDSFVNGTGDPEYLGWTGRLCALSRKKGYDITHYNLGIRRETSADIADRSMSEVLRRLSSEDPTGTVFSFGVNDTTLEEGETRVHFKDSIKNTTDILTSAKRLSSVLMVSPPPVADREQNLRIAKLSQEFALVCSELAVPYLDVFKSLQASTIWMSEVAANDGYHPSSAGYSELAELVQSFPAWLSWLQSIN